MNRSSTQYLEMLGERLEQSRLLRNIPQTELAALAGISPRTLRRLESGEGASLESFIRLLIALNLDSNIAAIIPDHTVRPMERTRKAKTERVRASRLSKSTDAVTTGRNKSDNSKNKNTTGTKSTWTWGDEKP